MNIIFQNSKCVIRCVESYGEKTELVPDVIKHLTCGIVPNILDHENIQGVLFLTIYSDTIFKDTFFVDMPSPYERSIDIYGPQFSKSANDYIFLLIKALVSYGLCFGPSEKTEDDVIERARELTNKFPVYE